MAAATGSAAQDAMHGMLSSTRMLEDRLPPYSLEAEQSVLGGLMLDKNAWPKVADRVRDGDFYRAEHRQIFLAIRDLVDRDSGADLVTLTEKLRASNQLEAAGGIAYLGRLANETPSAANIVAYADIVREHAVLRALITAGTRISELGFLKDGRPSSEVLDEAERLVFEIAEHGKRMQTGIRPVRDILSAVIERVQELSESDGELSGLASGLNEFDQMTSGLQDSDLIIVAGRPGMGKTSLALRMAENVALKVKKPVAVFSMEMSSEQLAMRMLSSFGRIDVKRLRSGDLRDEDWPKLTSATTLFKDAPIYFDETPALSPMDIRARARRLKREHDISLIVVDYLQLMQIPGSRDGRTNEISEISRNLKALAKELNVPVIALSQLSRAVESREDRRPRMSDLRESGGIEQDADLIVFIYRDEFYTNEECKEPGVAEIIIGKHRNGPTGHFKCAFLSHCARFENLARNYEDFSG